MVYCLLFLVFGSDRSVTTNGPDMVSGLLFIVSGFPAHAALAKGYRSVRTNGPKKH